MTTKYKRPIKHDWLLCEADLQKAEAHVVAFLTQDANMIEAFESGIDVHSFNASKIFGIPIDEVIYEHKNKKGGGHTKRDMGKRIVHACVSNDTEILTQSGWSKIEDISTEEIAIYNPKNKEITFEVPKLMHSYEIDEEVYELKTNMLSQIITKNHNMPYVDGSRNVKIKPANELVKYKRVTIPVAGDYSGKDQVDENLVRLLVATQADGSYSGKQVRFHLKKKRKINKLIKLLTALDIEYKISYYEDNSCHVRFPQQPSMFHYLTGKQFNWNLLQLDSASLDAFLSELYFWDGSMDRSPTARVRVEYCSANMLNCEIVSTIAHLRNKQGLIRDVKRAKIVSLNKRTNTIVSMFNRIQYTGMVYCPTVSTGCFFMRRNNCISITGNSNYLMGPQTFSDNLATEEIFMNQTECKQLLQNYTDRFPGLPRWHLQIQDEVAKTRILYNLFNRPRRFLGDMNAALFRNAYSYKPQSTVAELLNKGLVKMSNDLRLGKDGYDIRLLTTVHDSVVFKIHKSQWDNILPIMLIVKDHMSYTFTHKGRAFTIGLDAKFGHQWAGKTAEVDAFTQDEIDRVLRKIEV